MAVEDHAEHVEDLALLVVRRRPLGRHARHVRRASSGTRVRTEMRSTSMHVEQLVVHAEARLLGEVVDAVDGGEERVALALEVLQRRRHGGGSDQQRGVLPEEDGAEDGVRVGVAQLLRDQLQSGGVGHQGCRPDVAAADVDAVHRAGLVALEVGDDLLGADAAVADAPALVGLGEDRGAQLEHAVRERLGPRRAAGDVDVDREELVARDERVVVEHAHRGRAGAHRDHVARLEHLLVDAPDDRRHLDRDPARQEDRVGLARRGARGLEAEARDVDARAHVRHPLDRAAREAEREREVGVADRPAAGLLQRRREHALLDVLLQLVALELAAQHVAGAQLAGAELRLRARIRAGWRVTSIRALPSAIRTRRRSAAGR